MADHPQKQYQIEPHHEVKETFADQIGFMMFDGSTLKIDFVAVRMKGSTRSSKPNRQARGATSPIRTHKNGASADHA